MVVGKLLVYLGQKFPLPEFFAKSKFILALHSCDLCFGVWIYFFLALLFKMDIMKVFGFTFYFPLLNEAITGGFVSYVVHIFFIGLRTKYEVVTV